MNKTLELIVAAVLLLVTAVTIMTMVTGQIGILPNMAENETSKASCSIEKAKFQNACECLADEDQSPLTSKAREIRTDSTCENAGEWECNC